MIENSREILDFLSLTVYSGRYLELYQVNANRHLQFSTLIRLALSSMIMVLTAQSSENYSQAFDLLNEYTKKDIAIKINGELFDAYHFNVYSSPSQFLFW